MSTRKVALAAAQQILAKSAKPSRHIANVPCGVLGGSDCISRQLRLSSTGSSTVSVDGYVSPYQDFFDMMESGRTSLGTEPTALKDRKYLECGIPEDKLMFKAVTYGRYQLAPFVNPAEHKITMTVRIQDIPLETDLEHEIFHQIVGRRFMHSKQQLKLTSGVFASRIENKRHLCSMLERIVANTKRLAKEVAEVKSSA